MTAPQLTPADEPDPPQAQRVSMNKKKKSPSSSSKGGAPQPGAKSKKIAQDDQVMAVSDQ